jgi:hypothetical protein
MDRGELVVCREPTANLETVVEGTIKGSNDFRWPHSLVGNENQSPQVALTGRYLGLVETSAGIGVLRETVHSVPKVGESKIGIVAHSLRKLLLTHRVVFPGLVQTREA